ncbi:hypothetical protein E1A91_A04G043300v1 [Gossypium mustelinum]|uniref:RNase H type-1 domain-containing protein n=2 Tax=Gossypium TaxID=3633 RepID=A0A5J5W4M7_GOSBA|nr:hypothetical protein ES319_A04G038300v1 [Gossypium barbadense]TYJ39103.1 hypothetical protein E1A91_A04G043300v1 [Gossypium mustelinum]
MVESNSIITVTWCIKEKSRPWKYCHIFAGIDEIKMSIREELFRIIGRDANGMADSLAKSGCFPSQMLFADW